MWSKKGIILVLKRYWCWPKKVGSHKTSSRKDLERLYPQAPHQGVVSWSRTLCIHWTRWHCSQGFLWRRLYIAGFGWDRESQNLGSIIRTAECRVKGQILPAIVLWGYTRCGQSISRSHRTYGGSAETNLVNTLKTFKRPVLGNRGWYDRKTRIFPYPDALPSRFGNRLRRPGNKTPGQGELWFTGAHTYVWTSKLLKCLNISGFANLWTGSPEEKCGKTSRQRLGKLDEIPQCIY